MSDEPFSRDLRDQELRDTTRNVVTEYRLKSAQRIADVVRAKGIPVGEAMMVSVLDSIGAYKDKDGYYTVGSGFTSPYTALTDYEAVLNEVRRALRMFVLDTRVHRDRLYMRAVPDSGPILQRWLGMLDWPEILMVYGGQHGAIIDCLSDEAAVFVRTRLYGGKQRGAPNSWSRPTLSDEGTIQVLTAWERLAREENERMALKGFEVPYPEFWDEEAKRSLFEREEEYYGDSQAGAGAEENQ